MTDIVITTSNGLGTLGALLDDLAPILERHNATFSVLSGSHPQAQGTYVPAHVRKRSERSGETRSSSQQLHRRHSRQAVDLTLDEHGRFLSHRGVRVVLDPPAGESSVVYALVQTLQFLDERLSAPQTVRIFTSCTYLVRSWTSHLDRWAENRWVRQDGSPVKNAQAWYQVLEMRESLKERGITVQCFSL